MRLCHVSGPPHPDGFLFTVTWLTIAQLHDDANTMQPQQKLLFEFCIFIYSQLTQCLSILGSSNESHTLATTLLYTPQPIHMLKSKIMFIRIGAFDAILFKLFSTCDKHRRIIQSDKSIDMPFPGRVVKRRGTCLNTEVRNLVLQISLCLLKTLVIRN